MILSLYDSMNYIKYADLVGKLLVDTDEVYPMIGEEVERRVCYGFLKVCFRIHELVYWKESSK